jgi:copper transport protein
VRRRRHHLAGWLAALLLVASAALGPARAHAVLVEAEPEDGASLAESPAELRLRFNEPVTPLAVRLLDGEGREVAGISVEGDDASAAVVRVRLAAPLPRGGYYLGYRVASADAHAVRATLRFGVGGASAPDAEAGEVVAAATTTPAGGRAAAVARWLVYVTALGSAGLVLFAALIHPPPALAARAERLAATLAALAFAALAVRLGAAGLELTGLPISALLSAAPWAAAASSTLGLATALAAAGLPLLAGCRRLPRWSALLGAVAVGASFGLTGHAATAAPRWLTGPALSVHVLAGAFWVGSFVPLGWSLTLPTGEAAAVLRRFSRVATHVVAGLVVAGAALVWVQLGDDLAAAWRTAYGWRLLGKLGLVAALLALAVVNRAWLTPGVAAGAPGAGRALRCALAADLALGLGVLAVTATFPFSPPARALQGLPQPEESLAVVAGVPGGGQATFTLLPGRAGANRLQAWVTGPDGAPLRARGAWVARSPPDARLEPVRVAAALPAPGVVVAEGLVLPRPGRWTLRLDLLTDDFANLTVEATVDLR